jgi:hypothetical protein
LLWAVAERGGNRQHGFKGAVGTVHRPKRTEIGETMRSLVLAVPTEENVFIRKSVDWGEQCTIPVRVYWRPLKLAYA